MNSNNEIKFNFKADLTDLKSGVNEAKNAIGELSNFTVNWGEGSGSIEEYNETLKKSVIEWGEYQRAQEEASQASQENVDTTNNLAESQNVLSYAIEKVKGVFSTIKRTASENLESVKTAFGNVRDSIEGYTMRMNEATSKSSLFNSTARQGRAALLALSASMLALAKSSIDEYAKSSATAYATQESVNNSLRSLKVTFAAALQPMMQIVANVLQWATQNRQLIASLLTGVTAVAGFGAAIWAITKVVAVCKSVMSGWVGVIGLVVGALAAAAVSSMDLSGAMYDNSQQIADIDEQIADLRGQIDDAKSSAVSAGGAATKQIDNIDDQLAKLRRDYLQSLKQIAVAHEETVADLTRQIEEANVDYQRAVDERNAAFKVSQAEEAEEHQAKVDELMNQINFLQRYNNKYNQEKLEQLKFALAREENLYKQRTAAEEEELRIQNENEKIAHEQKLASLQAELDDELAFQNKHRDALNEVRDVILLDEIESLQQQEQEQEASLLKQQQKAIEYGYGNGDAYTSNYIKGLQKKIDELNKKKQELLDANDEAKKSGYSAGSLFGQGAIEGVWNHLKRGGVVSDIWRFLLGDERYERWTTQGIQTGWATGGFTGRGDPNEVAGVVHKGEYVLPADMVDQTTGTPKVGATQNIVINVNGTFATSATERRKVAEQIADALNQTSRARLGA